MNYTFLSRQGTTYTVAEGRGAPDMAVSASMSRMSAPLSAVWVAVASQEPSLYESCKTVYGLDSQMRFSGTVPSS